MSSMHFSESAVIENVPEEGYATAVSNQVFHSLTPIEAESQDDEESSEYGSDYFSEDFGSQTTSLHSSVLQYEYENGRRYHRYKEGRYVMPNDETEQDRLDMMHHICLMLLEGQLHLAPIGTNPQRILDLGTGTGIWAIDVANQYPSAEVIGTDLSAIQPSWVPPNCRFEVDDAESHWTFARESFDLVHSRHLTGAISDWKIYIQQIYDTLKPGGWVQFVEYATELKSDDNRRYSPPTYICRRRSYPPDCALREYFRLFHEAANRTGRISNIAHKLKSIAIDVGFVEVSEKVKKLPWAPWPNDEKLKELGRYALLNCETSFEAFGLALFTRVLGLSKEDAIRVCSESRKELRNKKIHVYNLHHFVIARKPMHTRVHRP